MLWYNYFGGIMKKILLISMMLLVFLSATWCIKEDKIENNSQYKDYKLITSIPTKEHIMTEVLVRFDGILYGKSKGIIDYIGNTEKIGTIIKVIPNKYIPKFDNETNSKEIKGAEVYSKGDKSIILKYSNEYVLFERIDE